MRAKQHNCGLQTRVLSGFSQSLERHKSFAISNRRLFTHCDRERVKRPLGSMTRQREIWKLKATFLRLKTRTARMQHTLLASVCAHTVRLSHHSEIIKAERQISSNSEMTKGFVFYKTLEGRRVLVGFKISEGPINIWGPISFLFTVVCRNAPNGPWGSGLETHPIYIFFSQKTHYIHNQVLILTFCI